MPYLPLDLDAKRLAGQIGFYLGVGPGPILWGLTEAWEHVWRKKSDTLADFELGGCFAAAWSDRLAEALVKAGFVERAEAGWRIRGAAKWLFGMEGQVRAGRARAATAIRVDGKFAPAGTPAGTSRLASGAGDAVQYDAFSHQVVHQPAGQPLKPSSQQPAAEEACVPGFGDLRDGWNSATTPPLPRWEATGKHRKRAAYNALKRRPLEVWLDIFRRIEASDYCRGAKGWLADVDWAMRPEGQKPEPAQKVLEGAYDNRSTIADVRRGVVQAEDIDWDKARTGSDPF